jgi:putative spermidine/putrescine transport system ATP-binding protein
LRLHATLPAGAPLPEVGDQVALTFNREHLHVMEGEG